MTRGHTFSPLKKRGMDGKRSCEHVANLKASFGLHRFFDGSACALL